MAETGSGSSVTKKSSTRTDTKRPHKKGVNRLREAVPLSTSPKCKKAFWPRGMK